MLIPLPSWQWIVEIWYSDEEKAFEFEFLFVLFIYDCLGYPGTLICLGC
jgi:hypothetical protein